MIKSKISAVSEIHRGMSFGYMAQSGFYATPEAEESVDKMSEMGVTWVALMVSVLQETFASTRLYQDFVYTVSDGELESIIARFHAKGIRVMLKPMVECHDSVWRGHINFPDGDEQIQGLVTPYWDRWFSSLRQSLLHYARIAQKRGCEMFCLGCELYGAEQSKHNERWDAVIEDVRSVYSGALCYDAQPQTLMDTATPPKWMRALDAVCVSYYTSASSGPGASVEEMIETLRPTVARLRRASENLGGLPIIFGETGCRSVEGGAINPAEYRNSGAYAPDEQANFLEAMCRLFWNERWWRGFYWWKWDEQQIRPHYFADPTGDTGFTLQGKSAESTMRKWFLSAAE